MNVYSHVVFDVDGTLLDTEYSIIRSLQRLVFQMHGTRISEEDLQFSLGITGADALKQLNIPDTEENFAVWNQFADEEEHTIKVFEKIEETLKKLKEKGVHLGVITSRSREEYEKGVSSRGLGTYFEIAVCCDDTQKHKPNPDPMLYYLEKTQADPDQVLYIGDSIYDMKCAKAVGVKGALALWGCRSKEPIEADYYLKRPEEALNLAAGTETQN